MWRALAMVLVVWAVAYLTPLGVFEFRGDEPRRVLPAIEMLDSGDYLVPRIGGEPYVLKPPLINWLVAASFKIFGVRNEWTARLPSAVFVLAAALVFLLLTRSRLGQAGSTIAALGWLTNFGILEKGQTIEIEAIYVSIFAFALIAWVLCWEQDRSPWITWLVPSVFLGIGLLAKGPAHLIFFYLLVGSALWQTGKLRELLHPAHFVGIMVTCGIVAAWAVPYVISLESHRAVGARNLWEDVGYFFSGTEVTPENWWLNFPKGFAYYLPWVLLLPFARISQIPDQRQRAVVRGFAWATVPLAMIMLLPPGSFPRYILPLMPAFCWVLGTFHANDAFEWRLRLGALNIGFSRKIVTATIMVVAAASVIVFPLRAAVALRGHERIKPIADRVNAVLPPGQRVYAIKPYIQSFLVYVHSPITYLTSVDKLPPDARYVLIHTQDRPKIEKSKRWQSYHARLIEWTPRHRGQSAMLYELTPL